jgi:hypothetical protein
MKIHLHKEQSDEKTSIWQIIGLSSPTKCYEIYAWFELTKEEQAVLDKSPDLKKKDIIEYYYQGRQLNSTVNMMTKSPKTGEKGSRFVAYTSDDFLHLEKVINNSAKNLKNHLDSLMGSEGSSTIEI